MNPDPAVLLAEDNEDDLFLSSRVLAKASLQTVHHVADGREAIDYLAGRGPYADRVRHPLPDILLLDLKMPGHTGHEVLEWPRGGHARASGAELSAAERASIRAWGGRSKKTPAPGARRPDSPRRNR